MLRTNLTSDCCGISCHETSEEDDEKMHKHPNEMFMNISAHYCKCGACHMTAKRTRIQLQILLKN